MTKGVSRHKIATSTVRLRIAIGLLVIFILYLGFIVARSFQDSALLDKKDRMNIVFYGQDTVLLSFGLEDDVHYLIRFSHNDRVWVPGGYWRYPVGSLGRFAEIEDDSDLMRRTFSSMISAYVDYYVYPKDSEVFEDAENSESGYTKSTYTKALFSSDYVTNASLIDKVYLASLISDTRESDFVSLRSISEENEDGELDFSERRFTKKYKGFFFHQSLREEGREVQIVYSSYPAAVIISRIIEGQGIRVVDLEKNKEEQLPPRCLIEYDASVKGKTVHYLAETFECDSKESSIEGADIRLTMGESLTEEWK